MIVKDDVPISLANPAPGADDERREHGGLMLVERVLEAGGERVDLHLGPPSRPPDGSIIGSRLLTVSAEYWPVFTEGQENVSSDLVASCY